MFTFSYENIDLIFHNSHEDILGKMKNISQLIISNNSKVKYIDEHKKESILTSNDQVEELFESLEKEFDN